MLKIPDLQEAEAIFKEAGELNPGDWIKHSRYVAVAARLISSRCPDMDEEASYILGLLHDIGRYLGTNGLKHIIEGYRFLSGKGYDDCARICMTHSFPYKDINSVYGQWNCSREETAEIEAYITRIEYDEYDKLIQLCDSLALPSGFCLLEKRFVNTAIKSGINSLIVLKWKAVLDIKRRFDLKAGCPIYGLLPDVVKNTFEAGLQQSAG